MTMFAHNLSATSGSDSIASLLDNITNGPDASEDTTLNRLATVIIGAFPRLLNLPNPMKRWADMLRTELGKIAQEVWDEAERNEVVGGMDARVLEVLSKWVPLLVMSAARDDTYRNRPGERSRTGLSGRGRR